MKRHDISITTGAAMSSLHHWLVALGRGLKRDKHKRRIEEGGAPGSAEA
jgi:hypothetical protein